MAGLGPPMTGLDAPASIMMDKTDGGSRPALRSEREAGFDQPIREFRMQP